MIHQVFSIEQAQELINLGLDMSDASCVWLNFLERGWTINPLNDGKENVTVAQLKKYHGDENVIPTYTLQDILSILSQQFKVVNMTKATNAKVTFYSFAVCNHLHDTMSEVSEVSWLDAAFELLKRSLTKE